MFLTPVPKPPCALMVSCLFEQPGGFASGLIGKVSDGDVNSVEFCFDLLSLTSVAVAFMFLPFFNSVHPGGNGAGSNVPACDPSADPHGTL